jgi:hypothetical protein
MKFEGKAGVAGGYKIVIDGLRGAEGVAGAEVAFEAGVGSLIQALGIREAGGVAMKARGVMTMDPFAGWTVAGFALHAGIVSGFDRWRGGGGMAAEATLLERLKMLWIGKLVMLLSEEAGHFAAAISPKDLVGK